MRTLKLLPTITYNHKYNYQSKIYKLLLEAETLHSIIRRGETSEPGYFRHKLTLLSNKLEKLTGEPLPSLP